MVQSPLREVTEPAVLIPEVAKQHDVFVHAIAYRVPVSLRASFGLEIIRKLFGCFNKDLSELALVPPTVPTVRIVITILTPTRV